MNCRAAIISFVTASAAGCALRGSPIPDERNDVVQYVLVAPMPLSQAIIAAENHTVGKAIRAELLRQSGKMQYRVLVTAQGRFRAVDVDPVTGLVLSVTP